MGDGGNYKKFRIGDLFDIRPTKSYKMTNTDLFRKKGTVPVVTNSGFNNGISGTVALDPTESGNKITFSDTTTSNAIFYQPNAFIGYSHIQGLYSLDDTNDWNEKTLIYFLTLFRRQAKNRFDYARKFQREIAADMVVSLPVDEKGNINFCLMRNQIQELEKEIVKEVEINQRHLEECYLGVSGVNGTAKTKAEDLALEALKNLADKQTQTYKLVDMFTSQTGDVDLQQRDINGKGEIFINSGKQNFGIKGKTDRPARIFNPNTITIDLWGLAYYRPFKYKLATHNDVFSLSGKIIKNEKVGLYLVASLRFLRKIFQFFHKATWNKVNNFELRLPVKNDGTIDFEFMETAINAVTKEYLHEIEIEHQRTLEAYKKAMS